MKKMIFACVLIFIISCEKKLPPFYHGVVVDEYNKPIDSVIIDEDAITIYPQSTITIKDGKFKLYRVPNFIPSLIFSKKGYITDTVNTSTFSSGDYDYRFLNAIITINDTLVLKKTATIQ